MTLQPSDPRVWTCQALTDIWTGRVTGITERHRNGRTELREEIGNDRLILTGILGSIRWWFEVLVRGLGGNACDPSNTKCQDRNHCVVCELFGCTGWARKFRFQVLAGSGGEAVQSDAIAKGAEFRLRFQPLRAIAAEEWALLDLTLRLIADYGAIGGKTVLKPSDDGSRAEERHHQDYGIIKIIKRKQRANNETSRSAIEAHVRNASWRSAGDGDFQWASLRHFWWVNGRYLARQNADTSTFNRVIGRREPKSQAGNGDGWLAGRRPRANVEAESKKVFSFKRPARTFGFVNPGTMDFTAMKGRLQQAWPDLRDDEILTGDKILGRLLSDGAGRP